jgi:hypothetical protein
MRIARHFSKATRMGRIVAMVVFRGMAIFVLPIPFSPWPHLQTLSFPADGTDPKQATLTLMVQDEHDRPLTARLRVRDTDGHARPVRGAGASASVLINPRYPELGIVVPSQCQILIPPGKSMLVVDRGTEYHQVMVPMEITGGEELKKVVRLRRWINMAPKGWWSGDLHVHRLPQEMNALMDASDLHVAPTITKWNENSSLDTWPKQAVVQSVGRDRFYSVNNSEDERPWGAALFLGLTEPIGLYPRQAEYPPPFAIWQEARKKGGFVDLEKAIWWEAPVVAALMPPDSIGVAVNQFLEEEMRASEAWGRPRDQKQYPGDGGWANYIFDLYYKYLSAGFRTPASAGSANGVLKNPLGYNRTYVYLDRGFSYERWWEGQKTGRNFVTNGPMLFLSVNGKMPGTIFPGSPSEVSVQLEAISAGRLTRVELIVDGAISQVFTARDDPSRISASAKAKVRPGGWLAARCFEENPVTVRFAHSSPVYFGEKPARSPEALEYLRSWIDDEMQRIQRLPSNAVTDAQRAELLALCRKARQAYE